MCVRLTNDEIVIRCRDSATATAVGFVEGPTPAALTVRDGDLEIAIEGLTGLGEAHPDAPSTDVSPALLLPAGSQGSGETLSVQEAEWFELDDDSAEPPNRPQVMHVAPRKPRGRPGDTGDAPTRIHRLEELLGEAEFATPSAAEARGAPPTRLEDPAAPRTVVASRGRLSPGARRFALLGMLACSLMLCLRARRVKEAAARAPQARVEQGVDRPPDGPVDSAGARTAAAPRPMPNRAAAPPHAQANKGSTTKARRAADALAEGDYAEALELYEALASEEAKPAYARIVDSLRSRPPTSP